MVEGLAEGLEAVTSLSQAAAAQAALAALDSQAAAAQAAQAALVATISQAEAATTTQSRPDSMATIWENHIVH